MNIYNFELNLCSFIIGNCSRKRTVVNHIYLRNVSSALQK